MNPNNYDVNIWNRGWHETEHLPEGELVSQWMFSFNEIVEDGAGYGTGRERQELDIYITDEEAEAMTLGLSIEEGGDYTPDSDFWLDSDSIKVIYKNIPERILNYLNSLPNYEMQDIDNDYPSVLN